MTAPQSLYRDMGCGTVTTSDKDGEHSDTDYYGRLPEFRNPTLTEQLLTRESSFNEGQHRCGSSPASYN